MLKRISKVREINVQIVSFSSHLQIGDCKNIYAVSHSLAVKRDQELFFGNEGNLQDFTVFSMPLTLPPITEKLIYRKQNSCGSIFVKDIHTLGVSSSSIIQIGSNDQITLESRRKEIRHITEPKNVEKALNQLGIKNKS